MQNIRSVRGVRKEINYSKPCTNATDKAQLSLGCTHLNTRSLCSCSNGYNPNSTVLYLGHLSTVRNNLFHEWPSSSRYYSSNVERDIKHQIMRHHVEIWSCNSVPLLSSNLNKSVLQLSINHRLNDQSRA